MAFHRPAACTLSRLHAAGCGVFRLMSLVLAGETSKVLLAGTPSAGTR